MRVPTAHILPALDVISVYEQGRQKKKKKDPVLNYILYLLLMEFHVHFLFYEVSSFNLMYF